jgi:hypothetical protein
VNGDDLGLEGLVADPENGEVFRDSVCRPAYEAVELGRALADRSGQWRQGRLDAVYAAEKAGRARWESEKKRLRRPKDFRPSQSRDRRGYRDSVHGL